MTEAVGTEPWRGAPIPYRSPRERSGWDLPDGARVALWVIPNVEVFRLDLPVPGGGTPAPDVLAFAPRDYGGRVGFWRVLDLLQQFEVPTTVAFNSDVCDAYPPVVEAIADAGWELMGHCRTNSIKLSDVSGEEETAIIEEVTERIRQVTGARPRGWLGSGLAERWETLAKLEAAGYDYVSDWVNDDRPNMIRDSGLLALPYSAEINDKIAFDVWHMEPERFTAMALRQFEVLDEEGADEPRVMAIALHPYLIGMPHRIKALRVLLEDLRNRDGIWWATGAEIADRYRATATTTP